MIQIMKDLYYSDMFKFKPEIWALWWEIPIPENIYPFDIDMYRIYYT